MNKNENKNIIDYRNENNDNKIHIEKVNEDKNGNCEKNDLIINNNADINILNEKQSEIKELDNNFNLLDPEDFDFKFCDFFSSLVSDNKKNKIYNVATKNLNDCIEINSFLLLKQEVALLKELLFDAKQLLIFDTFSKVINLKGIFKEIAKKEVDFKEYDPNDFKNVFESLNFIIKRKNNEDKKIIEFINIYGILDIKL